MKLGIAIPTYNEATNIELLITHIFEQLNGLSNVATTLLVIDDSSPDGTADIVKKMSKKLSSKNFQVVLFSRKVKNGLGRAYLEGFDKLIKMDVEYILQMDADLSHNPVYIPAFIKVSKEHDFVVGSRYIPGGETPDWTISRRIMSKLGNIYASSLLGGQITDYTGGFNMYSVKLLHKIELNKIESTGYGFLIEIKYKALINAKSVYQVPIVFNDRQHGKSKIPKDTIVKNLVLVPRLKHNTKKPH